MRAASTVVLLDTTLVVYLAAKLVGRLVVMTGKTKVVYLVALWVDSMADQWD